MHAESFRLSMTRKNTPYPIHRSSMFPSGHFLCLVKQQKGSLVALGPSPIYWGWQSFPLPPLQLLLSVPWPQMPVRSLQQEGITGWQVDHKTAGLLLFWLLRKTRERQNPLSRDSCGLGDSVLAQKLIQRARKHYMVAWARQTGGCGD